MPVACFGICCAETAGSGTCGFKPCAVRIESAVALSRLGSVGSVSVFGLTKLKALVRSPSTARRYALMFVSLTLKRSSRKRSTEV